MRRTYLIYVFVFLLSACVKKEQKVGPELLAQISDKKITVEEFIQRSEYTIRPPYCKNDNYIHRKIILNSLIAEKLLALEADRDDELAQNKDFQLYIQGRKEQAMRQWHFYQEAYSKVHLDSSDIKKVYKLAGLTYDIAYFSIKDSTFIQLVQKELFNEGKKFKQVYQMLAGENDIPQRTVSWDSPEQDAVHEALFSEKHSQGQILGPIQITDNNALFIKINKLTERLAISEKDIKQRWDDVSEKLTEKKAWIKYESYVSQLMSGKRVQFFPPAFKRLIDIAAPLYVKSEKEKKEAYNRGFWQEDKQDELLTKLYGSLEKIEDLPLFQIENVIWTIGMFKEELKRHPIVFRKGEKRAKYFPEQYKLAIVDMIRDRYITEDARKKGYDKAVAVIRTAEMWKDNLLAVFQKYKFLESIDCREKDQLKIVRNVLTPYVDELQNKYSDQIHIDMDNFEKITLSKIDMIVVQPDMPFPLTVPVFPLFTVDSRLDYGEKIE